jgi:hypothetical protein
MNTNEVEESVVAKSTGKQDEKDMATKNALLFSVLSSKRKLSKSEADYREQETSSLKRANVQYVNSTWPTKKNVT